MPPHVNYLQVTTMNVREESSRIVKPIYGGIPPPTTSAYIPLSVFDKVTFDCHVTILYAFPPPTPSNATLELGLQKALSAFRPLAGMLGKSDEGNPVILLNDQGLMFVEASVDGPLDRGFLLNPSPALLSLHPMASATAAPELAQVQITRFACGSMVMGFTRHHRVADANSGSNFLTVWGQACRGLEISPVPFLDRTIFTPRDPPRLQFEHRGVEFISKKLKKKKDYPNHVVDHGNVEVHKVHFTLEFLTKLKAKASSMNGSVVGNNKPYTTFESLVAHLWRAITKARSLRASETTHVRISVSGRTRLQEPSVPKGYFGNVVLWAFPTAKVKDLLQEPLPHAAKLIHEAIAKVNGDYFKSFVDFASYKLEEEELVPTADVDEKVLCPNLEVNSWVRFPFYEVDFGGGRPDVFMPSYSSIEGLIFLAPSFLGDGSIDAFITLFQDNLASFKKICYSLD